MNYIPQIINALNLIKQVYIRVPTIHKPEGIVRERVFCYEFYHQMRLCLSMQESVIINGEIDKSGSPLFNGQNPDFVFHKPASNDFNAVVCEVKGNIRREGVEKDLRTLSDLLSTGLYKQGVLIIYGVTQNRFLALRKQQIISNLTNEVARKICLITLPSVGLCEEPISLFQARILLSA